MAFMPIVCVLPLSTLLYSVWRDTGRTPPAHAPREADSHGPSY